VADFHGNFVGDSWFGGVSWSTDERYGVYKYLCIYIFIYMYIYIYIYMHMYAYINSNRAYIYNYMYIYIYRCLYMYRVGAYVAFKEKSYIMYIFKSMII
jgi:hypothetical protein